jgi:hypothetical protein
MTALDSRLTSLAAGAARHAARGPAARAALALETARTVAAATDAWVESAVAVKTRHELSGARLSPAAGVRAEETATGPLATLRLLAITARALDDVAREGVPRPCGGPRVLDAPPSLAAGPFVGVDVLPERRLLDGAIFRGHACVVRCAAPGDRAAFADAWREEARLRPAGGGVCLVLGAGNVTGLAAADAIAQIFEHGRAVLLKLHPVHAPLEPALRAALRPLVAAGVLEIVAGGAETARAAVAADAVTHVHLTGGQAAFDALVWGASGPRPPAPVLTKPITCELGNVTPWIVVPGRYSAAALAYQADIVAASIANNTSFNCIATKCVVTCRSWEQRDAFLTLVARRLDALAARPAWYPGSTAAWEAASGGPPPASGLLPVVFRPGIDPLREPHWLVREWFVPVATEVPLAAGSLADFCDRAAAFARGLPGSLAASVTAPDLPTAADERHVARLTGGLEKGTVAVNTWSALAYAIGSAPWGGFPGGTLAAPRSGLGRVHDPLLLPGVHDVILRAPLVVRPTPPWLPWHRHGARLSRGVVDMLDAIAADRSGLWQLARMLPAVLSG